MSTEEYAAAMDLDRRHSEGYDANGPFTEADIVEAETALGVTFPADFRRFLAEFGSGYLGVQGMYGLVPDPSHAAFPNIVRLTLDNRARFDHPDHLLVISNDGYAPTRSWTCAKATTPPYGYGPAAPHSRQPQRRIPPPSGTSFSTSRST